MTMGAWNLVVNSGVTLSGSGNVTSVSTTGTVTNNGSITAIYSSSAGTSTIIELRGVAAGSSIYVGNESTSVTTLFQSDVAAGTYRAYFAPGVTASQLIAREKYGIQRESEVIPLTGGLIWYQFVDIPDVGIVQPTLATVQAYTSIENADKFYDRTAAFRLTEQGIKLGQITTRNGTTIDVSAPYSVLIDQSATDVYDIDANLITLKATGYANGTRYINTVLVAPATLEADTNEVLSADFEDANGDSAVTILGGDGDFELWKVTTATPTANYTSGTKLADVGNEKYRFSGIAGFDIVGVDINSNVRRRTSMAKGIYTQSFYVGDQIQLAQAPQVITNGVKLDILAVEIEALQTSVGTKPTLSQIEGSTILAKEATVVLRPTLAQMEASSSLTAVTDVSSLATQASVTALGSPLQADDYTAPDNAGIAAIEAKVDTLENADLSGVATSAEVLALGTPLQAGDYTPAPTLVQIEASTVLAKEATAEAARANAALAAALSA
jgi:hypothetical protein